MIVQGNLLGLDPQRLYLYSNTLQAIATGYLIASVTLLHCSFKWQIIVTCLLLLAYWVPMTFSGRFYSGGELCGESGPYGARAFPRRCILERRRELAFLTLLYLYLDFKQSNFWSDRVAGYFLPGVS